MPKTLTWGPVSGASTVRGTALLPRTPPKAIIRHTFPLKCGEQTGRVLYAPQAGSFAFVRDWRFKRTLPLDIIKINYKIKKEDYMEIIHNSNDLLQYYLYRGSKTKQFKIRKILYYFLIPIMVIFYGVYNFYTKDDNLYLIIFFIIGVLAFILLPKYLKNSYERHYKNFINNNFGNLINKTEIIEIMDDKIINKNSISESSVNISEIKYLIELKNNYVISINDAASLILPKNIESKNIVEIIKQRNNLDIVDDTKWKW